MSRIIKWKFSEVKKGPQRGVDHIDIEGSSTSRINAYKTRYGGISILKSCTVKGYKDKKVNGAAFVPVKQLAEFTSPRSYLFKSRTPSGAIENAMWYGRHVYGFESLEQLMRNKHKMLNPTRRLKRADFSKKNRGK